MKVSDIVIYTWIFAFCLNSNGQNILLLTEVYVPSVGFSVELENKSKKFIVHSPAGLFSDTRQSYNSLSSIYKKYLPKKRKKKLPKFPFLKFL